MPSQTPVKNETIPFQIPSKKVLIFVHTSVQLVPNQPRTTSATPFSTFRILVKKDTMPLQTDENISLMPFHICDQLPVNRPINTSSIPVITPVTVDRISAIWLNTPSKTGARNWHRPSHTVFITSVIS